MNIRLGSYSLDIKKMEVAIDLVTVESIIKKVLSDSPDREFD